MITFSEDMVLLIVIFSLLVLRLLHMRTENISSAVLVKLSNNMFSAVTLRPVNGFNAHIRPQLTAAFRYYTC